MFVVKIYSTCPPKVIILTSTMLIVQQTEDKTYLSIICNAYCTNSFLHTYPFMLFCVFPL